MDFAESYVPWFTNHDNVEANGNLGLEGLLNIDAIYNDKQTWDSRRDLAFPVSNVMASQDISGESDSWSDTLLGLTSKDSPVRYDSSSSEGGRAAEFSALNLSQDEWDALIKIAMPTNQSLVVEGEEEEEEVEAEEYTAPEDSPSPKRRRKASPSNSAKHFVSDSRREGHNAIEKRYRSNLNSKISSLEQCLPVHNLSEDKEDLKPVRTTKSAILTRAINHVELLQQNTRRLTLETENLSKRFKALEKLVLISVEERTRKLKSNDNVCKEKGYVTTITVERAVPTNFSSNFQTCTGERN